MSGNVTRGLMTTPLSRDCGPDGEWCGPLKSPRFARSFPALVLATARCSDVRSDAGVKIMGNAGAPHMAAIACDVSTNMSVQMVTAGVPAFST
jgi:hypothetical protein